MVGKSLLRFGITVCSSVCAAIKAAAAASPTNSNTSNAAEGARLVFLWGEKVCWFAFACTAFAFAAAAAAFSSSLGNGRRHTQQTQPTATWGRAMMLYGLVVSTARATSNSPIGLLCANIQAATRELRSTVIWETNLKPMAFCLAILLSKHTRTRILHF